METDYKQKDLLDPDTLKKVKEYEKTHPMSNCVVDIGNMIDKCLGFIESTKQQFLRNGVVSEKQLAILKKMSVDIGVTDIEPKIKIEKGAESEIETKEFLDRCLAKYPVSTFVKSVVEFYNINGFITDKQRASLIRTFDNSVNRGVNKKVIDTESEEYKNTLEFLKRCEEAYPTSNFVKSVKEQFLCNGMITEKQRNALTKSLNESLKKVKINTEMKIIGDLTI